MDNTRDNTRGTGIPGHGVPAPNHGTPAPGHETPAFGPDTPTFGNAATGNPASGNPVSDTATFPTAASGAPGAPVPPPPVVPPYATFPGEGPGTGPEGRPAAHGGKRRRMRRPAALITAVAVGAAVIGGGTAFGMETLLGGDEGAGASVPAAQNSSTAAKGSAARVAQDVSPSVVEISASSGSGESTGSGIVLTRAGEIVTNNHVVAGAETVQVSFSNGKKVTGKVVGNDPDKDLALVKVSDTANVKPATLGDSDSVGVGDNVVAIGSPEGLSGTVTSGIVSAKDREVKVQKEDGDSDGQSQDGGSGGSGNWPFEFGGGEYNGGVDGETTTYKAIQTDASLNPGNSGGALVNMSGQVIGINSAMLPAGSGSGSGQQAQSSSGSVGLGFAIPVNDLKKDLDKLRDGNA
ncbi:S1C family serine protease [Streptomyces sp. NBC_01187]|uniref:S1C family serine protease n=1 Tax=Streptomyces sp. NBC_01187 TaxID=2903766 RepID=UPI00386AF0D4